MSISRSIFFALRRYNRMNLLYAFDLHRNPFNSSSEGGYQIGALLEKSYSILVHSADLSNLAKTSSSCLTSFVLFVTSFSDYLFIILLCDWKIVVD
jgi:hypothetical protein